MEERREERRMCAAGGAPLSMDRECLSQNELRDER
jgi:hypothetical protein